MGSAMMDSMTRAASTGTPATLRQRRESFFAAHPRARDLDEALHTAGNPTPLFFLVVRNSHPDLRGVGFAIGRLGDDIERQYLINGEVAFFFAPWKDFQRRSFNAITSGLQEFSKTAQGETGRGERFTVSSKVVVLVSEDPQVHSKVEEWQENAKSPTLVIPLHLEGSVPSAARDALLWGLRSRLGGRDLYRTQNPVTGVDFFGRQAMLRTASAALESDENIVILGLRRSGKTSILRELKRQLLSRGTVVTLGDFQVLDEQSVQSLATSIARNLVDDLRDARSRGLNVKIGTDREGRVEAITLPELADRVKRTANRNPSLRFVLAVDEIESAARLAKTDPSQVRTLLGALRSAAQACSNVSLAFAGVANRMFRTTVLGSGSSAVDNPMFGQVTSLYITAFEESETSKLLTKLGRPMFLDWTDDAAREVQSATGGMPYFVRNLASAVRKSIKDGEDAADFSMLTITASHVAAVLPFWRETAAHDWAQLIEALRLHYPEATDLLDPALSVSELEQWIGADALTRDAADDLAKLGLLERSDAGLSWHRSASLEAIHRLLEERPTVDPTTRDIPITSEDSILDLIKGGEAHNLELKETFRVNSRTNQRDERMETEVVRAVVALMNSEGGRLVVGVHDTGEVKGLARDLALFKDDLDRLERWIIGDLLGRRIDEALVSQLVRLLWVTERGVRLCLVEVQKSNAPAWLDDSHLYVRAGNQSLELTGRKLAQFLAERG